MHCAGAVVAAKNAAATRDGMKAGVTAASMAGRGKASPKVSLKLSSSGLSKTRRSPCRSSLYKPDNSSSASTQKQAAGVDAAGAEIVKRCVPNLTGASSK